MKKNTAKVTNSLQPITPPPLQKGDTIAFAAPARNTSAENIAFAQRFFEEKGFKVRVDEELWAVENQFAGSDAHRAQHLNKLFADSTVKAIVCVRGGYGSLRMVDQLGTTIIQKHPKWLAGFSDITVLHAHFLRQVQMESIHSSMPIDFPTNSDAALESLLNCLTEKNVEYIFEPHALSKAGQAAGSLVGGNLSILYSLVGSVSFPETKGRILFIEDVDEYLYHIDRMMLSLKRAGYLDELAGLIVGGMTKMHDNAIPLGKEAEAIIAEHVAEYSYPVCFGFPAGHQPDNRALVFGRMASLTVESQKKCKFVQELPSL